MSKIFLIGTSVGAALVAVIVALILSLGGEEQEQQSANVGAVGVLIPGSITELGWNGIHYRGVSGAAEELGANLLLAENVREGTGQCARAIDSLVDAGAGLIILASYNFSKEVVETMRKYPKVLFFGMDADVKEKNHKIYFARVYQARYLSGLLAGLATKTNKVGYVGAMKNNEVVRGINAFALGVRKANPKAKVYLRWTGSWDNAEVEVANVGKLVEQNRVDVVAYHQNQDWILKEADALGIMSIGYNLDSSTYSPKVISAATTNWKMVYKEIIQDYLQQKKSITNYWVGIEKDAVGLAFYSSMVDDSSKKAVDDAILEMKNGMEVFKGPIYDNKGKRRCGKDEILSDTFLRENMDWFVDGVVVYEE